MLIEELKKVLEIELIDESNYDKLYDFYLKNIDEMRNKNLKSGEEVFNFQTADAQHVKGDRLYFFVLIGNKTAALIDSYLENNLMGSLYLKYFQIDKSFKNFEVDKEIMRDFTSIALKNYSEIVLDINVWDKNVIDFYNSLGCIVSTSVDKFKIRLKSID